MTNYIYGKVKRKQNIFRIIETETDVYDSAQLTLNGVDYNPETLIEEEELYQLTGFSNSGFLLDFLQNDLDSVNHDQITKADLKKLSYICTVQDNLYFFQIINSSFYISKKWFSIEELELETEKPIITINPFADAIYNKETDTLYFKRLGAAQKIFKGMDQLYKAATDAETEAFLSNEFLAIEENFLLESVTIPNRKRIALVNESLSKFSDDEKLAIYDYTNSYGKVEFADGKFKINTDEDLKFVLWGIEQRFYTTPIGGEQRVANSIIAI
jgi:hypothetical protein